MRIRNNKVTVFLSDDEKFILKRDSSRLNLSQSEDIRLKFQKLKKNLNLKKMNMLLKTLLKH